jgi:hypothetical protein
MKSSDLLSHLFVPHGLGRVIDVHHHCPLEVGYCVQTVIVRRMALQAAYPVAAAQPCRADPLASRRG